MIAELLATLHKRDRELEGVQHRLDQLLRQLYGPKAERFNPNQPTLFDGIAPLPEPEKVTEPTPPPAVVPNPVPKPAKRHGRRELPKNLKRERVEHDLSEAEKVCPCCQESRVRIGEETSEQLDYRPASLFVVEHVRHKYVCRRCSAQSDPLNPSDTPAIVVAPKPVQPIDKGLPGPGLLAHIVISKYVDHLPLYRQESILARQGVYISRSTMCDWMAECAGLLTPLYLLLKVQVLSSRVIHTDDTPVPVLAPGTNKTKKGRLWVYIGDRNHPALVYDYTPNHSRAGPEAFLTGFQGIMQADSYNVYDGIYASGITEVGCWAHARRYFFESKLTDASRAHEALARIGLLYDIEREAKELIGIQQLDGPAADALRLRMRQERSLPLVKDFFTLLEEWQRLVLPKSPIGKAVAYALNIRAALTRYTSDGMLNIDNNVAERALRAVAIGRKNWMFAGSDAGGQTAAVLYTVLGTCKYLGVEPFAWLRDVLARLPEMPNERLDELLPLNWAQAQGISIKVPG